MASFLPLIAVAVIGLFAVLIAGSVRRARARMEELRQQLVQSGYRVCDPTETRRLEGLVRTLHGDSNLQVRRPWKRGQDADTVYWYEVRTQSSGDHQGVASDEFLCTLRRRSSAPLFLFIKPAELREGFAAKTMRKVLAATAPPGLHALDLKGSRHSEHFLAAFGPQGASLSDLVDDDVLASFARAGDHGINAVRCRDDLCAFELHGAYARRVMKDVRWQESWSYVRRIAA
jgi:hypothetical protein